MEAVSRADVAIVVGTSAVVYPAAGLPELALAEGIPVIEVNPERDAAVGRRDAHRCGKRRRRRCPALLQRLPALLG